jgi:hypothetical protein
MAIKKENEAETKENLENCPSKMEKYSLRGPLTNPR